MPGELEAIRGGSLPALDPLEVYSGLIGGRRHTPLPPDPDPPLSGTPREVLEALLVEPLSNPPCHVAFSGGRDSSAMLAAATHVARTHGLDDPIPLSARLEKHPRTWETEWQELVIGHLGLHEWSRLPITDQLDALGPEASGALRRHGMYWPSQGHSMLVFSRHAGRGSMLTGGGGDEVFTNWSQQRIPLRRLAKLRPRRRAFKWMAFTRLPQKTQAAYFLNRSPVSTPWLRPEADREVQRRRRERALTMTKDWNEVLEGLIHSRYLELLRPVLDTFAADYGVRLLEPFYDPRFIRAMGRAAPRTGYLSRTHALEAHFSDLLPPEILRRSTKAVFSEVAWGPHARAFVSQWDGEGLDDTIVDLAKLREEWAKERPNARSLGCLHQAYLAAQGA
jgi:asparagine synthetase B (glutamine-hydrolysing)